MTRLARLPLAAAALFLVVSCHGDRAVTPDLGRPSALIFDGANSGGNPDFFFLPPMVRDPSGNSNFDEDLFNATLISFVDVCQLTGDPREDDPNDQTDNVTCDHLVFGPVAAQVSASHYQVNWHTDASNNGAGLDVAKSYRIQVYTSAGGSLLGFADIEPVSTGKELKNLRTGDVIGLIDGRTLPIKFRIEVGAACFNVEPCTQQVINLSEDNTIILEGTGDRVDIPPQNTNRVITVTLQLCDGVDVDLPKFGHCLTVTSNPPLGGFRFSPAATVSMCSVFIDPVVARELAALGAQEDLVTMHRQDNGDVFALPHGGQFCDEPGEPIGSGPSNLFQQLARSLGGLFAPRPLHAATVVLDVGPSGETDFFSDFQLALPAQMFPAEGTDEITGQAGGEALPVPAVVMTDAGDPRSETPPQPVEGALVTFRITGGGGNFGTDEGEDPITEVQVLSDENGRAAVPVWILGDGGATNTVTASGRGFAGPTDDGPFMPEIHCPVGEEEPCQETVELPHPLDAREVVFTATTPAPDLVVSTGAPTVTPSTVAPGGTVTLSPWTNFNQGNANATSDVSNGFYLSTDPVITTGDVRLDGNSNSAGVLGAGEGFDWGGPTLTIPANTAPGVYYIGILVDEGNALRERNELNNYVSTPLTVVAVPIIR